MEIDADRTEGNPVDEPDANIRRWLGSRSAPIILSSVGAGEAYSVSLTLLRCPAGVEPAE